MKSIMYLDPTTNTFCVRNVDELIIIPSKLDDNKKDCPERCQNCEWYDKITSCQGMCVLSLDGNKHPDSFCNEWTKKRKVEEEDEDI